MKFKSTGIAKSKVDEIYPEPVSPCHRHGRDAWTFPGESFGRHRQPQSLNLKQMYSLSSHHRFLIQHFFNLRVFIKDKPQQEEQETMRLKYTEFAAVKLPRCPRSTMTRQCYFGFLLCHLRLSFGGWAATGVPYLPSNLQTRGCPGRMLPPPK